LLLLPQLRLNSRLPGIPVIREVPWEALKKNIQGKVFITFVVEKDGSLTDIKIVRGIGGGCDEEAVRVMKMSPKWNPGTQNNHTVRVFYTTPISFTLQSR